MFHSNVLVRFETIKMLPEFHKRPFSLLMLDEARRDTLDGKVSVLWILMASYGYVAPLRDCSPFVRAVALLHPMTKNIWLNPG